ncbi:glycosyltransferase family 2 protein [Sabulibacter ruber]|uniref:glycosyltransferase family 2 protein n=1 Tax=Sabulibacter ruber TaxID=2811901 RepID=UPI001F61ADC6|nr:glycosyltransferase [Sabulibacter ruber]
MIPVYNCAEYIPDVLNSVLAQDPGEDQMQIEVVDDHSTDTDVELLVQELGKGRIGYYRQPVNVGSLRNFETCLKRSTGRLVHLLHGDDRVKPGFYKKIASLFQNYPQAGAAFSSYSFIDEQGATTKIYDPEAEQDGILENWLIRIAERQRIQYAAMVVRREVYEKLGGFYGINYGEDWEMWVRIAKSYPVAYTPEVLAEYRGHLGSLTWEKAVSGKTFTDLLHTINVIQKHIPENHRKEVMYKAKEHCANFLIGMAFNIWKESPNWKCAQNLIRQALLFSKSPYIIGQVIKFYIKTGLKIYKVQQTPTVSPLPL